MARRRRASRPPSRCLLPCWRSSPARAARTRHDATPTGDRHRRPGAAGTGLARRRRGDRARADRHRPAVSLKLARRSPRSTRPSTSPPDPGTDDLYIAEQGGKVRRLQVKRSTDSKTNTITKTIGSVDSDARCSTSATRSRPAASRACSASRSRATGASSTPTTPTPTATPTSSSSRWTATEADARNRRAAAVRRRSPSRTTTAASSCSGPTATSTSGWATAAARATRNGNGQNTQALLGKILRIDPEAPSGDKPYGIPAGNPFADGTGGAPRSGSTACATRGASRSTRPTATSGSATSARTSSRRSTSCRRSWAATPARAPTSAGTRWRARSPTRAAPLRTARCRPVFDYPHTGGNCSVTGGFVYRGAAIPDLQGVYVFADYCVGDIRGLLARNTVRLDERSLGIPVARRAGHVVRRGCRRRDLRAQRRRAPSTASKRPEDRGSGERREAAGERVGGSRGAHGPE